MSFDLIVSAKNHANGRVSSDLDCFNYTSNVLSQIRLATGNPSLWENDATSPLQDVITDLWCVVFPTWARNRDAYLRLDPVNEWGDLDSVRAELAAWTGRVDRWAAIDHDATVTFLS